MLYITGVVKHASVICLASQGERDDECEEGLA